MKNLSGNKDIGRRIKLLREKLRISQERLGELLVLGVSYQQVQKYEKGVNKVSAERLYRIAQALNVPLDFFFEGREESRYEEKEVAEINKDGLSFLVFSPKEQKWVGYFRAIKDEEFRSCLMTLLRLVTKR